MFLFLSLSAMTALAAAVAGALTALPSAGGLVLGWPLPPDANFQGVGSVAAANAAVAAAAAGAPPPTPECARVLLFLRRLAARGITLPTTLWDERGSSVAARAALRSARAAAGSVGVGGSGVTDLGRPRAPRALPPELAASGRVDALAAVVILDDFLDAVRRGALS
jgi:hypothetical protein